MTAPRLGRFDADNVDTAILITVSLMGSFIFTVPYRALPWFGASELLLCLAATVNEAREWHDKGDIGYRLWYCDITRSTNAPMLKRMVSPSIALFSFNAFVLCFCTYNSVELYETGSEIHFRRTGRLMAS